MKNTVDRFPCLFLGVPSSLIMTFISIKYSSNNLHEQYGALYGILLFLGILITQCIVMRLFKKK